MATTLNPPTEATKALVNYRVENGVAVIEMNDPPANTYTYEMNRQFDEASSKGMDNDAYVIVLTGAGDSFSCRSQHQDAASVVRRLSTTSPSRQRNAAAVGAHARW
jgi:enoyl-CoA hydratase/carnithine racemase